MSVSGQKASAKTTAARESNRAAGETELLRKITGHYPKYVAFLRDNLGLEFRGRILELGAGAAWFSAELSKLPKVVEMVATDFTAGGLQQHAPHVFKTLRAHEAKISRRPASPHRLNFPDRHFDFVVCAGVLHDAMNLLVLLREIRRVLKPGGQLVAVREPVKSLVSRGTPRLKQPLYSRADYEDVFERAGFTLTMRRISLATGLKYYFDKVVNGLTHARYVFIATRNEKAIPPRSGKVAA